MYEEIKQFSGVTIYFTYINSSRNVSIIIGIRLQVVLVVKNLPANAGDRHKKCRFDPWVGKIPWKRKWQPTPAFLPGKFRRQRSLVGYSPWGCRVGHDSAFIIKKGMEKPRRNLN